MRHKILDTFWKGGLKLVLKDHSGELPHLGLLKITDDHNIEHINFVWLYMNLLMSGKIEQVVDLPDDKKLGNNLRKKVPVDEDEQNFLLFTAMYHDIGKNVTRPRHGPVGAEIILHTEFDDRKKFYDFLKFSRRHIYLLSNLIRFHDYLGMVGTGETSYLAFVEVLNPISNLTLINKYSLAQFLDYLLLINLADIAGSKRGKIDKETSIAVMHDFDIIRRTHECISKKVYAELGCAKEIDNDNDLSAIHEQSIAARNLGHIIPELKTVTEDNTIERLRRLLRTSFLRTIREVNKKDFNSYSDWVAKKYLEEGKEEKKIKRWFIRDDETHDVMPIAASLSAINVKRDFYEKLAFICKLDYESGFISGLFKSMILYEVSAREEKKKTPHDFRRDLAMTLITFVNTMVELFGDFTQNSTRIGLGFERMQETKSPYKEELLRRLTGEEGVSQQAEAMTTFKHSVNLWII